MTSTNEPAAAPEVNDLVRLTAKGKVYRVAAIHRYDDTAELTVARVNHPERAKQLPDKLARYKRSRLIAVQGGKG